MEQRPKLRNFSNLKSRIFASALLIPFALFMIYTGPPYTLILAAVVAIGLFIEWAFLGLQNHLTFWPKFSCGLLGTIYLVLAILWLFKQLALPDNWMLIFWIFFLVWSTDIAAYIGGSLLGGPKLAPSISPKKTWSGFIIGMIGGTSVAYGSAFWLLPNVLHVWEIALLVLIAQGGDLLESKAKRWSNVKDSSFLIPGHGGLLDRLDSLLAVSFALTLWQFVHS